MLSYSRLSWIKRFGTGRVLEAAETVPYALLHPKAIFEGLCRDGDEDSRGYGWRCYVASPIVAYTKDGSEVPWPEGFVFVVFVNSDGIAYNWRRVPSDPRDAALPLDYDTRFREKVL